jgi:hypothetical protein
VNIQRVVGLQVLVMGDGESKETVIPHHMELSDREIAALFPMVSVEHVGKVGIPSNCCRNTQRTRSCVALQHSPPLPKGANLLVTIERPTGDVK